MSIRPTLFLATAFLVYGLVMYPLYAGTVFAHDSFYNIWRARKILGDPLLIFRPDVSNRFNPLYMIFSFSIDRLFGFSPLAYGLMNGSLHLLNTFLLFQLVRRLWKFSLTPALLTSLVFLFSSMQWGMIWETGQTMRLFCIFLFLLSLLCFAEFMRSNRKILWGFSLLFFISTFGFAEDAVGLPAVLIMFLFLFPARQALWRKGFLLTLPFFLVSLGYAWLSFSVKAPQGWGLGLGPHILVNQSFLIREFVHFLLIPRSDFIPFSGGVHVLLRLSPLLLIAFFAGALWRQKGNRTIDRALWPPLGRFLIFGVVWIVITSFLYSLRHIEGAWQGRYLYLPGMGEAVVVGIILYSIGRSLRPSDPKVPTGTQKFLRWGALSIVFYGFILNLLTTYFMVSKSRNQLHAATREEIPSIFSLTSAIRDHTGSVLEIPPDLILVVEGLPFSLTRLKELLQIYYTSLPRRIVEAKEGLPVMDLPALRNGPVLYAKWENETLQVVSRQPKF